MSYRTTLEAIGDDSGSGRVQPVDRSRLPGRPRRRRGSVGLPGPGRRRYGHREATACPSAPRHASPRPPSTRSSGGPGRGRSRKRGTGAVSTIGLVDTEELRREWLSDRPDYRSMWMLHAVWLRQRARGGAHLMNAAGITATTGDGHPGPGRGSTGDRACAPLRRRGASRSSCSRGRHWPDGCIRRAGSGPCRTWTSSFHPMRSGTPAICSDVTVGHIGSTRS